MSRFRNSKTGVEFSVDDSKDDRYADGRFESADEAKAPTKKAAAKKAASSSKSEK